MSKMPRKPRTVRTVVTHEQFFVPRQLAKYLGCSIDTVRRRILDGTLPAYKFGGAYRSYKSEVDDAIKSMRVKAKTEEGK